MTITPQDNGPADAASANSATANSPPRRRLRKRWIILGSLLALMGTSVWLILRDEPLAVMKLPDGRTFTIHKLTYGTEHYYHAPPAALTPVEVWLNQQLARFGRQIAESSSSSGNFSSGSGDSQVGVWHSFDWTKPASDSTPHTIVLTGGHGWRTSLSTQHLQNVPPPPVFAGQRHVPPYVCGPMPSPVPVLQVELFNARGGHLASTRIPYNVPNTLKEKWTESSFETVGNMTATITTLRAEWTKYESTTPVLADVLKVVPELVVTVDGLESKNWAPLSEGVPFFESWSSSPIAASVRSFYGSLSQLPQCTASPHDPLWKLHLPIICTNPDEVLMADRVHLGKTRFQATQPTVSDTSDSVPIGKASVQILGAVRAGKYDYEGAGETSWLLLASQSIEWWTRSTLTGTVQATSENSVSGFSYSTISAPGMIVRGPQHPVTVLAKFTAPRPHVVITLTNSGDRFPFVIVKDENGRVLEGELFNAMGLLIWLAKEAYDDVEQVDVTLLLQKPRVFTFVVPPPKMPPRPVAAAK